MNLLTALDATRDETLSYYTLGARELDATYGPGKWSVRYLLHHLADSETVLAYRIRSVLGEGKQVLKVYDQDAWARALDYSTYPLQLSRDVYEATRAATRHLALEHYERSGHLEWVHSETGLRTLRQEFDKVAEHNEHHLAQIRAALSASER
jgi:hypothetical protein